MAIRCPCCDAVDVDTRHARICPRSGAQVNQHQPLLHAISRTLKRLRIPHQVESGEPFTAERNLRMDIVIRRGSLQDAPNREYRDTSPSCWTSPTQTRTRRYTYEEVVLVMMVQPNLPRRRASANTTLVRDMCPSTNEATNLPLLRRKALGALGWKAATSSTS